jgi:hypothetical protein
MGKGFLKNLLIWLLSIIKGNGGNSTARQLVSGRRAYRRYLLAHAFTIDPGAITQTNAAGFTCSTFNNSHLHIIQIRDGLLIECKFQFFHFHFDIPPKYNLDLYNRKKYICQSFSQPG